MRSRSRFDLGAVSPNEVAFRREFLGKLFFNVRAAGEATVSGEAHATPTLPCPPDSPSDIEPPYEPSPSTGRDPKAGRPTAERADRFKQGLGSLCGGPQSCAPSHPEPARIGPSLLARF